MRLAMIRLDKKLLEQKNIQSKMLLQIHDELIFEVPKKDEKIMIKLIKEEMTSVAQSDYHSFSTHLLLMLMLETIGECFINLIILPNLEQFSIFI